MTPYAAILRLARVLIPLWLALPGAVSADALERVSVQLLWKHQFEFAAFYAAQEQGYYRQAGLDVEIKEGGPGIDTVREVSEGHADFGVGTSALVVDHYRGRPVVSLAALMQHSPTALLALRRNGIQSVHDLAGRPVAVDPHNRDEIEAYFLASGIPRERIRLVDQTDWTMASLDRGEVAAKVVYLSNEPYWIRGREHEYLILTPRSAGIDLFGNTLFTTASALRQRPAVAKAFREATLKGLVYALAHPEEITDLILARYNSQAKSREHLLFEAAQIAELTRPDIVEPGYQSAGRWRHVVEVYAGQGKLPADFDLAGFIYDATPHKTPAWLVWSLAGLALLLAATVAVLLKLRGLNRRLSLENRERAQAERALQESEAKYRELVEHANAIVLRLALDGTVTYFNEYAERFFGYRAEDILGRHVVGTIVPERESDSDRDLGQLIEAILARPEDFQHNENENMTRNGRRVWVRWANMVIPDEHGNPIGISCIGQDVTETRKAEETIRNLAFFDSLTQLPNRRLLIDRLHQALAMSARSRRHGALLFIDLDNFKLLNDSHGHDIGDLLLIEVARRLLGCVREGDSVARLGGDEFVVMLEGLDEAPGDAANHAELVAEKIGDALRRPYYLGDIEHHATASVGIALFQDKAMSVDELLKRADLAMYQAKASGRNALRFFDPAMQATVESRTRMEAELRRAIQRGEFLFHYQPQVNPNGRIVGVEALARWQHPERGLVAPSEFIGLAEETGLIASIGRQLLRQACEQLKTWSEHPETADLTVSLNVSARQFHHPEFVDMVLANLNASGVEPSRLMLEITESLLLDNIEETVFRMNMLKARGIHFSIDDFGTGYSSLAYLKRLPLDELKIDRSFVQDIETDENDAAICAAFISLAHILGLRVVAEGVETEEQQYFLAAVHNCDVLQGYLYGKPMSAEQFTRSLQVP
ncbi:MAG: EAL domain-containing protein [Thiobacillus sp.]|nr:EAL domain-containing protein [Thiobacillus sp.]